jgi:type IV secretion system protein VirD4
MMQQPHNPPKTTMLGSTILAAGFAYGAYYFWPGSYAPDWVKFLAGGMALLSVLQAIRAISVGWKYLQDFLRYLRAIGDDTSHGSASFLTEREARRARLHKRVAGSRFAGVIGNTVIWLTTETHMLVIGPAGSSKSTAAFMNELANNDESAIVVDIKREFRETTAELRRKKFQHRIIVFDPLADETDCLNPLDYIFEFFEQESPAALSLARGLVLQLYPEPPEEGANKFFRDGTRIQLLVTIHLAVVATCPPEHRNLSTVYRAFTNESFLNELLMQAGKCTKFKGEIAQMADDLHRMAFGDDGAAKTYQQFRIGAMQALEAFGPGNYLAHITSRTTISFADLKKEKITAYLTVDFANKDVLGKWAGLMLWIASDQLVRVNNNVPVVIYHDECCNSPLFSLPTILTLLRSYGVKWVGGTQDLEDIKRVYGPAAYETILSETDIKFFLGGIRSPTTLEFLSRYLGDATVNGASYAFAEDGVKESISRTGRPLQKSDEIRRLRKDAQIVFYSNFKPILSRKVQVFAVDPWRMEIAPNSMYGGKRYLKPIEVIVGRTEAKVTRRGRFPVFTSRRWPLIAEYLLARSPISKLLVVSALITAIIVLGFPHLRLQYSFTGSHSRPGPKFDCQYVGLERFTLNGPDCPFIVLRKIW